MTEQAFSKVDLVGQNLLWAIGYGDSLGLPVETKKPHEILQHYGQIRSLLPIANKYFGEAPAGTWSDDTALSLAVAESLIEAGGFSMESMAEHHVRAMDQTPVRQIKGQQISRGWGKSTWESVLSLKEGRSWRQSGNPDDEGNGVLMKLAPFALWQAVIQPDEANQQIEDLAIMTHANDLAVVTALVHRDILANLLDDVEASSVLEAAAEAALNYENEYPGAKHVTSTKLGSLALKKALEREDIFDAAPKGGFHAPETLAMAYGAFTLKQAFPECVYQAVSLGGDTDSVCSITAAMAVMARGSVEVPEDIHLLDQRDRLQQVGTSLVDSLIA